MYLVIICVLLSLWFVYLEFKNSDKSYPHGIAFPIILLIWVVGIGISLVVADVTGVEKVEDKPLVAIEGKYVAVVNGVVRIYVKDDNQIVKS
jgi:hypothetical protein